MSALVTGGAGFIGSHLVDELVGRGERVLVLDDLSTGRLENLESSLATGRVEFFSGSTSDADLVDSLFADVDICFHLASAVGVQLIVDCAYESLVSNVRGCDVVMHAAARHHARLVFASSSEVYGKNSHGALGEDSDRLLGPPQLSRWSYAIAKSFGESLAFGLHSDVGAEVIVVRLFNTTGPRQTGAYGMVLPTFVRQALLGESLSVFGDGSQSRCFAHVSDTVRALLLLAEREEAVGQPFNIGAGSEITIMELAERVIARAGSASEIETVPFDEAYGEGFEELGRRRPDTSALMQVTGWEPTLTVDQAIDDLIAYERPRLNGAVTSAVQANGNGAQPSSNGHRAAAASALPKVLE